MHKLAKLYLVFVGDKIVSRMPVLFVIPQSIPFLQYPWCYPCCRRFWLQTSWSMCNNISAVFICVFLMLSLICIPLMLTISSCAYRHLEILFREVSRVATRGIWKAEGPILHRSKLCSVRSRTWGATFLPLCLVSSSILSFFPALLAVACLTFVITTHRKKAAEKEEIPSLL